MLGVRKNLHNQCKNKKLIKTKFLFRFYLSEYVVDPADLDTFTVYLKTLVTFALFNRDLFVFLFDKNLWF